jgi:hypothetical protein
MAYHYWMLTFIRPVAGLVAFLLVVAAGHEAVQTRDQAPPGYPAIGSPAIVKLLAPGADPKAVLRYKIPAGFKTSGVISLTMGLSMNMAGMALPAMDLPGMKMMFDLAVTGVTPAGDVTYDLAFTDMTTEAAPGLDPSVAAMIQGSAAAIKQIKGTATISDRGVIRSTTFDVSKMSDPNLKQALEQVSDQLEVMAVPVPDEAVGAGARWEVRQAMTSGGMTRYVRTEYELVSATGTGVQLRLKSETTAPPQPMTNPMLPADTQVQVEKYSGTSTGTSTLRMDGLVQAIETSGTANTTMSLTMGGQSQQMGMDIKTKTTIAPVKK